MKKNSGLNDVVDVVLCSVPWIVLCGVIFFSFGCSKKSSLVNQPADDTASQAYSIYPTDMPVLGDPALTNTEKVGQKDYLLSEVALWMQSTVPGSGLKFGYVHALKTPGDLGQNETPKFEFFGESKTLFNYSSVTSIDLPDTFQWGSNGSFVSYKKVYELKASKDAVSWRYRDTIGSESGLLSFDDLLSGSYGTREGIYQTKEGQSPSRIVAILNFNQTLIFFVETKTGSRVLRLRLTYKATK
jgi:hypothetical protein